VSSFATIYLLREILRQTHVSP